MRVVVDGEMSQEGWYRVALICYSCAVKARFKLKRVVMQNIGQSLACNELV